MLYETALNILKEYVRIKHGNNATDAHKELNETYGLDIKYGTLARWINDQRTPNAKDLFDIIEALGVSFLLPSTLASPEKSFATLPTLNHSPDNDALRASQERIAQLERELKEKGRQLADLERYKHRWEGVVEIEMKKTEVNAKAQVQQPSSVPPSCAGREPEARDLLAPGGNGPPDHDDSIGGSI